MNTIGHQIAKARAAAGIRQSELARALQVKPQAVQKRGVGGGPRHARLTEIAQALGVTVSYLVADDHNDDVLAGSICLTDHLAGASHLG